MENGKFELEEKEFSLFNLTEHIVELFSINAKDKNIKFREICRCISKEEIYQRALKELFIIPGEPFAYWINKNILNITRRTKV